VGGCVEAATSNVQWVAVLMRCEDVSMYTTFFSIALAEEYACGHMAVKFVRSFARVVDDNRASKYS
jgi:hypothetical protein